MSALTFTLHAPEDLVPCQQLPHARCPYYAAFMMPMNETKRRLRNTQDINQKTTRPKTPALYTGGMASFIIPLTSDDFR